MIMAWHRSNQTSKRLHYIPGVGPMLATALVASVADPRTFRSGRNFSAWIGLVPKQHSSGGKERLGSISKQGDRYLRSLFVAGALAVIRYAKIHGTQHRPWLTALLARRPTKVAAIALANKIARMAWASTDCELPHIAAEAFVVKYPRGQDHFQHTNWRTGGDSSPRLESCRNWKNFQRLWATFTTHHSTRRSAGSFQQMGAGGHRRVHRSIREERR